MSINLIIISSAFSVFIIVLMCFLVARKVVQIKYALIWIIPFFLILVALIVPGFLTWITQICGFISPSNLVICLFLAILILLSISTTTIISKQNKSISILIQENAILKKEVDTLKNRKNKTKTHERF